MKFVVIGSLNMDYSYKTERLPLKGETLKAVGFETTPGGKGANQAVALARLGGEVHMIGAVGNDSTGENLKASLSKDSINIDGIRTVHAPSGNAFITVDNKGNNTIMIFEGANGKVDSSLIEKYKKDIKEAEYVILQLEIPVEIVCNAVKLAKSVGTKVILNPAPAKLLPDKIYKNIDILTPNETELAILTGIKTDTESGIKEAASKLLEKGVSSIVVTLGDRGCFYMDSKQNMFVDSFNVTAKDTTAAGDSFTAGLAIALAENKDIKNAVLFAGAVGALTVTKLGAQKSLPYRKEVENFLDKHKNK